MNLTKNALYILTKDVVNPEPDRRQRHDWRKRVELKAGLKFRARLVTYDMSEEHAALLSQQEGYGVDPKWFKLEPAFPGTWAHQTVSSSAALFAPLVAALTPVLESLSDILREAREEKYVSAEDIVTRLVKTGRLPIEKLHELIEECHHALSEEGAEEHG